MYTNNSHSSSSSSGIAVPNVTKELEDGNDKN